NKAQTACTNLQELNPDVRGFAREISNAMPTTSDGWKSLLEEELSKSPQALVIAADQAPLALESLARFCYHAQPNLPLVVVQSYGLMGTVRLQLPPQGMALLEPKPTNSAPDLRLVTSFPAFQALVDSIDLASLDSQQHGHVPYPILLYKAAQAFKNANGGVLPKTFAEKQDFKTNYLRKMSRDMDKEVNFEEAINNSYLAYTEKELMLPEEDVDASSKLGRLCQALDTFLKQHSNGRPPLNGSIPDMTASTELYVQLQRIYKDQADQDLAAMTRIVQEQQQSSTPISQDDIANFCSNVYTVGHMSTRSLEQEYTQTANDEMVDDWKMALMDPYEGRHPGVFENAVEDDAKACQKDSELLASIYQEHVVPLYQLADQTQGDGLLTSENVTQICQELTRYGNAELHGVASVVGGVASQEAVKLITGQYVPVDNTYIYNGIVSVGGVYKF
ncbi:MAG: hypothetical protein SGILL_010213, partial [Bacillariaceae sp.]